MHRHAVLLKVWHAFFSCRFSPADSIAYQNKQLTFEAFSKDNPRPAPPLETRRRSRKRKAIDIPDDNTDDEDQEEQSDDIPQVKEEDDDAGSLEQPPLFRPDFGDEDEDEKPEGKPKLRVSYDGFSIFGK